MTKHPWLLSLLLCLLAPLAGGVRAADPAPFDLLGPKLTVTVTHKGQTLPIGQAPNLSVGDQLFIRADLPPTQSVHYLLVAAFLRGSTNPPPASWFYRAETWNKTGRSGMKIIVPDGAQQVLLFLAPQTGGDFKTLADAVRGRPGAFVRASQDLNQASLDRSRLDVFLAAVRRTGQLDADRLGEVSPLLARSLAIKLNADCLKKMPDLQAACLMEGQGSLVLSDSHSTSIVQALTTGDTADLITQLSLTPQAGFGAYSPYIGAVMDIARILDSFHTAQYQYIPALTTAQDDQLSMVLNAPPSFRNPMSVLVTALPAVESPQTPPLQPVDPKEAYCADKPELVLPVEGAPLAFSTAYAHDMVLHLKGKNGQTVDLPVKADPEKGGFVIDTTKIDTTALGEVLEASLQGAWGFDKFEGPHFKLEISGPERWRLGADDEQALIVGRDDVVHLASPKAVCVDSITLREASGDTAKVDWKASEPGELALTLPLKDAQPGSATLLVKQYGEKEPDEAPLQVFTQAGRLDSFAFYAGDTGGVLRGARLDEVTGLTFRGVSFKPGGLSTVNGADELTLASDEAAAKLKAGDGGTAKVAMKDGHSASVRVQVKPARPSVALISKSAEPAPSAAPVQIELMDNSEVEQGAVLTFSLRAQTPAAFSRDARVEIGGGDGSVLAALTLSSGLVLEDAKVAVATLDTGKAFNASTYGPIRFRIADGGGGVGEWQPLATLVRLPALHDLKCPAAHGQHCQLTGSNLFLIEAISADRSFDHPAVIPEGFTGSTIPAPHPAAAHQLYLKLHDAPGVVNQVTFPAEEARR